ncbi:MAG: T9SS type A sorting domain-containing protein, partial [Flavobacteriales bacterium]|nr:T9SS type A sorting domain-containing protein [Flavobacteriales bacterium]
GMYTVVLTATNSCGNSTVSRAVNITVVSTTVAYRDTELLIFPNPTDGLVMIRIKGAEIGDYILSLTNHIGQVVKQDVVGKIGEVVSIPLDLSDIPSGAYTVWVKSDGGICVMNIIKQ